MNPNQFSSGDAPFYPNVGNLSLDPNLGYYQSILSGNPQEFGNSSNSTPGTAESNSGFEIPTFSTQPFPVVEPSEQQTQQSGRGRGRGRGGRRGGVVGGTTPRAYWTEEDDVLLVSGFLNTTTDPIVNTDQTSNAFWSRVESYFMEWRQPHQAPRDWVKCKARWQKVNKNISKFVACYAQALNQKASGEADTDILRRAHDFYVMEMGKRFNEEHAWKVLRDAPKWSIDYLQKFNKGNPSSGSGSSKRSRSEVEGENAQIDTPTSMFNEHPIERPMGIKAAKKRGKQVGSTSHEQNVEYLKQKEKEEAEKIRLCHEAHMAKIGIKAKKIEARTMQMKYDMLRDLMAQPNLPPEGEDLKRNLMKELSRGG